MECVVLIVFLTCLFDLVLCGEYCYDLGRGAFYCSYGCCGGTLDEYCCGVYTWIIAVAVIGGIIFISVLVCVVCYCKKKQGKPGRVIGTQHNTGVMSMTTFNSGQPAGYGHQQYHPPPQPPPYNQQMGQPTPFNQQYGQQPYPPLPQQQTDNPAYPPPQYNY
ncbi:hypothetical protein ACF0H5_010183 [Mactra antiquata]